eukprot:15460452-Alexandrium_andersonii.AAC.1
MGTRAAPRHVRRLRSAPLRKDRPSSLAGAPQSSAQAARCAVGTNGPWARRADLLESLPRLAQLKVGRAACRARIGGPCALTREVDVLGAV